MNRTIRYSKGDFAILWKPHLCTHAGICVKMLPQVYDPTERPWVKPENASVEELKNQIDRCPSGVSSYEIKTDK